MTALRIGALSLSGFDAEDYFRRFGGLALGLRMLDQLAEEMPAVRAPRHVAIPLNELESGGGASGRIPQLDSLRGLKVMCRLSGVREAFSDWSMRGAASDVFEGRKVFSNPCFHVGDEFPVAELRSLLAPRVTRSSRAVVVQELVENPERRSFVVHADEHEIIAEIRWEGRNYLFASGQPGRIDHRESSRPDRDTSDLERSLDVQGFVGVLWQMVERLGFPANTEGHYYDGAYVVRQLRPIPPDNLPDPSIRDRMARVDRSCFSEVRVTRFAWGRYDLEGGVSTLPVDTPLRPEPLIVVIDRVEGPVEGAQERLRDLEAHAHAMTPELVAKARHSIVTPRPWNVPVVHARLRAGLPTVVIDFDRGFKLSHKPEFLPPPGLLRDRYCCVSLPGHSTETLKGRGAHILSDGDTALVCLE